MVSKGKKLSPGEIVAMFDGNIDLALFFTEWISNGRNARQAYLKIHPNVDITSAGVLGHRLLKKVNVEDVLSTYDLDINVYMNQLKDGLEANRSDMTGQELPDHKTRRMYHETLGKLLGLEKSPTDMGETGEFAFIWRAKGGESK